MSLHDVGLIHFSQWWKREKRTGFSYAEGAAMHGRIHYLRQSLGVWAWGLGIPLFGLAGVIAAPWTPYGISAVSLLMSLGLYGLLFYRAYKGIRGRAMSDALAREYAFFNVLTKFPMLAGMLQYWHRRWTGKKVAIIEYRKTPAVSPQNATT
jgi:hypothetical protein